MKRIYLFAAAAALLAACSSKDDLSTAQQPQQVAASDGSVGFDAYLQRSVTRAGDPGTMTTNDPNSRKLQDTGFGVFGYYTDNNVYEGQSIPNFMYNQKVTWNAGNYWEYSPVMYWPNEYGSSAIADDNDKVTFFAYAPYIVVNASTGKPSDQSAGITQLSRNLLQGDPYIKYIATFDWTKAVDLLWGVVPSTSSSWKVVSGETENFAPGLPWLDVERPLEAMTNSSSATQRVKFNFKHALSKLNVQVDYDADDDDHNETNDIGANKSRVYIRSISFTGFSMKGALNLNNTTPDEPLWLAYDAESTLDASEVTTLNDGRKDGREGVGGATAAAEPNQFINPYLTQHQLWAGDVTGVTNTPQNLFAAPGIKERFEKGSSINLNTLSGAAEALGTDQSTNTAWDYTPGTTTGEWLSWPVMVIPNGEEVTVTIAYDVETVDAALAGNVSDGATKGISTPNVITKTIVFSGANNESYMKAGKKYTLKLHLGLNSIKFDADVDVWDTDVKGEGWLPDNVTSYQAPGAYNYTVKALDTKNAVFKLTGFAPGESITAVATTPASTSTATYTAGVDGTVEVGDNKFTFAANKTVNNVTTADAMTFTGVTSGRVVKLNLVQLADQPALSGTKATSLAFTNNNSAGTFTVGDGTNDLTGIVWTGENRNVQILSATRDGVAMTEVASSPAPSGALQYYISAEKTITLGTSAKSGEKFVFIVKFGDAAPVTITSVVPAVTP